VNTIHRVPLLAILCGIIPLSAARSAPSLLAPSYPGAVRDSTASNPYRVALLTRDPIEKVRAFYQARVGPLADAADHSSPDNEALALMCQLDGHTVCYGKILMSQGNVARYLKHVTDAYDAGVRIEGRLPDRPKQPTADDDASEPAPAGTLSAADLEAARAKLVAQMHEMTRSEGLDPDKLDTIAAMGDIFDGLKEEVMSRHHTEDELLRIHARYAHLETAVYPYVRGNGRSLTSYDSWLLQRRRKALSSSTELSERERQTFTRRLEKLYAAGKFDEAQKLRASVVARGNRDRWTYWLDFLKELDAHAYRTRILIDVDPRSWGRKL